MFDNWCQGGLMAQPTSNLASGGVGDLVAGLLLGDYGPAPQFELVVVMVYGILLTLLAGMLIRETRRRSDLARDRDLNLLASRILQQMRSLTGDVVTGLGKYAAQIESVSRAIVHASAEDRPFLQQRLVELMQQMVSVNRALQARLNEAENQLAQQRDQLARHASEARTDALTGLPNRRAFDEACARSLAEWERFGHPFSLVLLDVDRFKQFNDQFGHVAGDTVLQAVASRLSCGRASDTVCRFGGEEFAILLNDTALPEALLPAELARQQLAQQVVMIDGKPHRVTVSVGVATVLAEETVNSLLERADAALYAAKKAGRNCTWYHDGEQSHPASAVLGLMPQFATVSSAEEEAFPETLPLESRSCYPASEASLASSIAELEAVCSELRRQFEEKMGSAAATKA